MYFFEVAFVAICVSRAIPKYTKVRGGNETISLVSFFVRVEAAILLAQYENTLIFGYLPQNI